MLSLYCLAVLTHLASTAMNPNRKLLTLSVALIPKRTAMSGKAAQHRVGTGDTGMWTPGKNVLQIQVEVFFKCRSGNEHIHVTNLLPFTLQLPTDFSILEKVMYTVRLKKRRNLIYIIPMLGITRFNGSEIQLRNGYVGNLAVVHSNISKVPDNRRHLLQQCYARVCVKNIVSPCKHVLPNIYVTYHFGTLTKFSCQFSRLFVTAPIATYIFQKCIKFGTVFFFPCGSRLHEFVPGLLGFFLLMFYSFAQLVNQPTAIASTQAIQHGQHGIHGNCSCCCIHNGLMI